jgi:MoxR-like ATPase
MPLIRCNNCGLSVQVPSGGRRLCGCGAWLSADGAARPRKDETASPDQPDEALELLEVPDEEGAVEAVPTGDGWPRIEGDLSAIERLNDGYRRIRKEMAKTIVGQERVLEELLIAIFARGHCLLVGVPGLAKTLMIRTLADSLSLSFSRIQFTPDLMPSDITGTEVLQEDKSTGQRLFKFLHGPIFANVILADEINRTPPKTQAALLEAMQERQVTVGGTRHKLPDPFFVLATQNPIEQEGTYPLPEAQQDRFMFNILVDYPEEEEEFRIVERTTSTAAAALDRVLSATDILEMQDIVRKVPVAPYVIRYAMKFTRLTRKIRASGQKMEIEVPDFIRDYVTWGAGPRATQFLILAAKARAVLHGRYYVSCDDVRNVAAPVLRHRIVTNFNAESEGVTPDDIVRRLIDIIPRDPQEKNSSQ